MKRLLIGIMFMFGGAAPALACSCMPAPRDAGEIRRMADNMARDIVALVEVDVRSAYNPRGGVGELMRVRRTLAGRAPQEFRIERRGSPQSAMCDSVYTPGTGAIIAIYRSNHARPGRMPTFRDGGLCGNLMIQTSAAFRQELVRAIARRGNRRSDYRAGESLSNLPCAPRVESSST